MINDYQLVLSDAQAITNATADSTYYIDTLVAGNAITPGATINVKINTACTTADGGTIIARLYTCTSSDLSTGAVALVTAPTLTVVSAAAGSAAGVTLIRCVIPTGCLRYLFVKYTLANNLTAGAFDAWINLNSDITLDGKG